MVSRDKVAHSQYVYHLCHQILLFSYSLSVTVSSQWCCARFMRGSPFWLLRTLWLQGANWQKTARRPFCRVGHYRQCIHLVWQTYSTQYIVPDCYTVTSCIPMPYLCHTYAIYLLYAIPMPYLRTVTGVYIAICCVKSSLLWMPWHVSSPLFQVKPLRWSLEQASCFESALYSFCTQLDCNGHFPHLRGTDGQSSTHSSSLCYCLPQPHCRCVYTGAGPDLGYEAPAWGPPRGGSQLWDGVWWYVCVCAHACVHACIPPCLRSLKSNLSVMLLYIEYRKFATKSYSVEFFKKPIAMKVSPK